MVTIKLGARFKSPRQHAAGRPERTAGRIAAIAHDHAMSCAYQLPRGGKPGRAAADDNNAKAIILHYIRGHAFERTFGSNAR
jgi:hypothetical protein